MPAVARGWRRCDEEKSRDLPKIVRRATKSKIKRCKQGSIEATSRIIAGSRDRSQWTSTEHTQAKLVVGSWPQIQLMRQGQLAHDSHTFFFFLCISSVPCGEQKAPRQSGPPTCSVAARTSRTCRLNRGETWKLQ